jgi:hypothetical protein
MRSKGLKMSRILVPKFYMLFGKIGGLNLFGSTVSKVDKVDKFLVTTNFSLKSKKLNTFFSNLLIGTSPNFH